MFLYNTGHLQLLAIHILSFPVRVQHPVSPIKQEIIDDEEKHNLPDNRAKRRQRPRINKWLKQDQEEIISSEPKSH